MDARAFFMQGQEYTKQGRFGGFSASTLKLLAIITMLIDHIGAVVIEKGIYYNEYLSKESLNWWYDVDTVLRCIGRIAFPIFAFFIVEGFFKTSNVKKYLLRLSIFALISEIPFDLALNGSILEFSKQNVYFTLAIGLGVIVLVQHIPSQYYIGRIAVVVVGMVLAHVLHTDYQEEGILIIVLMYVLYRIRLSKEGIGAILIATEMSTRWVCLSSVAYALVMFFYNGKKGFSMKYFFYFFYPVHLLILAFIKMQMVS